MPIRRRIEPGIFERVNAAGQHLGYEVKYKDADGKARRRSVQGDIHDARNALAEARTRRVKQEQEPQDPRVSLDAVIAAFEQAHVAGLRDNSRRALGRFAATHLTTSAREDPAPEACMDSTSSSSRAGRYETLPSERQRPASGKTGRRR